MTFDYAIRRLYGSMENSLELMKSYPVYIVSSDIL
jgi:hypothetical protein